MKLHLPRSTQNWITLIGAMIALVSLFMIIFLFTISLFIEEKGTYLGLVVFILLPGVMIMGLLLIPTGMILERRRLLKKHGKKIQEWPKIDLNDIRHRNAFFIFSIGTTILLFLSAFGSYEAYHFTESVTFCGDVCHSVMRPEKTAYQNSPHARVACVECHVGPGANWYVKSKISGLYQVYAVLANIYPKPIPTPVKNLRPARETCEECHWPEKFYAHKLRLETHFLPDEENTRWDIALIMKIGAPHSAMGLIEGIHWHINPDIKIEYISTDETREELPWVRYTNLKTNEVVVFQDEDSPLDESEIVESRIRTMDCMDCHNRPSHDYRPPALFINDALLSGEIPVELPEIRSVAVDLCGEDYESTPAAMAAIDSGITEFYQENYPEILEDDETLVEKAISGVQNAFSKNIFPEMKVRWDAYPNHIGHLEFNGCFRCHNDTHASEDGEVIPKDCNLCHIINAQGPKNDMETAKVGEALEFRHPAEDEDWQEDLCTDCHEGLNP